MINRLKTSRLRNETKEAMNSKEGCKHAIFGLCYVTQLGNVVEELADNLNEVKYFYDEESFIRCVDFLHLQYQTFGCTDLNIYAVHRQL